MLAAADQPLRGVKVFSASHAAPPGGGWGVQEAGRGQSGKLTPADQRDVPRDTVLSNKSRGTLAYSVCLPWEPFLVLHQPCLPGNSRTSACRWEQRLNSPPDHREGRQALEQAPQGSGHSPKPCGFTKHRATVLDTWFNS